MKLIYQHSHEGPGSERAESRENVIVCSILYGLRPFLTRVPILKN